MTKTPATQKRQPKLHVDLPFIEAVARYAEAPAAKKLAGAKTKRPASKASRQRKPMRVKGHA